MDRTHILPDAAHGAAAERIKASTAASGDPAAEAQGGNRRRVHIKSFGCQMNAYDAARMADVLAPEGYVETNEIGTADLVILNTCNIREKAVEKVYSELGRVREQRRARRARGKEMLIAVAGCVAQAEGRELLKNARAVDLVVGPQSYHRLPALLRDAEAGRRPVETEFAAAEKFERLPRPRRERTLARGPSAFVTVQEGCDKFCTFCVVPYTRGAEISRPASAIVAEVRDLAAAGVREVTLLGQNVNAYHGEAGHGETCHSEAGNDGAFDLVDLLHALAAIPGIERLRYTTSHPGDMTARLIEAHRDLAQLMPYLHLPVQSGSDRILKAMNRKHDADAYRRIIEKVRRARPDIALSSDFIVGFPGESDADFAATMGLVEETGFAAAYSFKYSPRPGTPAAERRTQVPDDVATQRLHALQALIRQQQTDFNTASLGRTLDVLVEKRGREPGQLGGKSPYLQAVHFEGPAHFIGSIVPVEIIGIMSNSLTGRHNPHHEEKAA